MSWAAGLELGEGLEIDLAAFLDEALSGSKRETELLLCECKSYGRFLPNDFDRMLKLGKRLPGSILAFVTMRQQLNPAEKSGILRISRELGPISRGTWLSPRVVVITGNELFCRTYLSEKYASSPEPLNQLAIVDLDIPKLSAITHEIYLGVPYRGRSTFANT
jgi:hypothetical protein